MADQYSFDLARRFMGGRPAARQNAYMAPPAAPRRQKVQRSQGPVSGTMPEPPPPSKVVGQPVGTAPGPGGVDRQDIGWGPMPEGWAAGGLMPAAQWFQMDRAARMNWARQQVARMMTRVAGRAPAMPGNEQFPGGMPQFSFMPPITPGGGYGGR